MRKIIALEHVSLDGYLADVRGEMDWIRIDDEMWDYVAALTANADAVIFGRKTYQMMVEYWPTAGERPGATPHDIDYSQWVNQATKIVVSRTLEEAPWGAWGNVHIVKDNLGEEFRRLKGQPGKNMNLIGSGELFHDLVSLGLVDEYQLHINPVVLGGGKPLFPELDARIDLELVELKTFPSGVAACRYRVMTKA